MEKLEGDIFKTKEYQEFHNKMQANIRRKGWKAAFTNAWKLIDIRRYLNKQKYYGMLSKPCTEKFYMDVIDSVNRKLVEKILEGEIVEFPYGLGSLGIYSIDIKKKPYKIPSKNHLECINWEQTFRLWFVDKEAREKKLLVTMGRRPYALRYTPAKFRYKNKLYYRFKPARSLETLIKQGVREGKVCPLYKYERLERIKH